ncbi:GIY-YIG nuclease family protein [Escherichia coli]
MISNDAVAARFAAKGYPVIVRERGANWDTFWTFECECGHVWEQKLGSALQRCICPRCRYPERYTQAHCFYIMGFDGGSFVKVGMSCQPDKRVYEVRHDSKLEVESIALYLVENGEFEATRDFEADVSNTLYPWRRFRQRYSPFGGAAEFFNVPVSDTRQMVERWGARVYEVRDYTQ